MHGNQAFSPTTGSPLGSDRHRVGDLPTAPQREADDGTGELTLGADKSTRTALQRYFERSFRRSHHSHGPADGLMLTAGRALYELKRHAGHARDEWVWLALCEYLAREGYWATWMHNHVELPCPRCGSTCRWEPSLVGLDWLACGANCGAESHSERSVEIVERVMAVYELAFGPIEELRSI